VAQKRSQSQNIVTVRVEREAADRPRASWKLRHTHAVDDLTWPGCQRTC